VPAILLKQFAQLGVRSAQYNRKIFELEKEAEANGGKMDAEAWSRWTFLVTEHRRSVGHRDVGRPRSQSRSIRLSPRRLSKVSTKCPPAKIDAIVGDLACFPALASVLTFIRALSSWFAFKPNQTSTSSVQRNLHWPYGINSGL
jgi:hypothetical protein